MEKTASSRWRAVAVVAGMTVCVVLVASSAMAQGAVVPFSGTLRLVETDLMLPAGAAPLAVTRAMPVDAFDAGLLGTRWRLAWERRLLPAEGSFVLVESEGPMLLAPTADGGGYTSDRGDHLEVAADGGAVVTRRSGVREEFDAAGRLVRQRYRNGNEHRLHYSADGTLRRIEGPKGHFLDLATEGGRLRSVLASNGERVDYTFEAGELTEVRVNGELTAGYGYLATGALSELIDPVTGTTTIAYDPEGRIAARRFSDGSLETHEYGADDGSHRVTDGIGGVTTMIRSADGSTLQTVDAVGNMTVTRLDAAGNPLTIRHPDGSESSFTYDALGRMISTVDPAGRVEFRYLADTDLMTSVTYPDGVVETFEYDDRGNLTRLVRGGETLLEIGWREDGLQSRIVEKGAPERSFEYLPNGLLVVETVSGEGAYRYVYDDRGYLRALTDPAGSAVTWTYDEGGRVLTETDPAGGTVRLAYDEGGLLEAETDPAGGQWRYRYDSRGRRVARTDPEGRTTEYVYDAAGRNTVVRLPGGASWQFEHDAAGNVVRTTNPLGGETITSYDSMGRVASITDETGQAWTYHYGPTGALDAVRGPDGEGIRFQRDAMGRVVTGTASSGRAEAFERDDVGRIRSVKAPDGVVERLSYDGEGRLASTADNRGAARQYAYDPSGRLERVRSSAGLETSLSYDAVGRLTGTRTNLGETMAVAYDSRGLVDAVRRGSATTRYEHDAGGRLTAVIDPLGGTRRLEYNRAGDLVRVTEASDDVTVFSYGEDGGLDHMTLPNGGVVELDFDPMGNLVSERNAAGSQRRYTYDAAGRLIRQTDAMGRETRLAYDDAGRLARRQLPDGTEIAYSYDGNGRLTRVDDGVFPVVYGFDAYGRRDRIEYPALERVIRMEYTEGGLLSRVTDVDRGVVAYDYDEAGRLASIQMEDRDPVRFSHDAGDRLVAIDYPNGIAGLLDYGPDGTVDTIRYRAATGATLAGWRYEYDAAGNPVLERDAAGGETTYRYDRAGRLVSEDGRRGEVRYTYGAGGNRAVRQGPRGRIDYSCDAANRLISAADTAFVYDPNGNLVEQRGPEGTTRYTWDVQDQLVAVALPDGETVRFGYAPTGDRVWREDSDGRVYYVSDGVHVLAELDGELRLRNAYLHGPGIDRPLVMVTAGQPSYLHSKLLGTVAAVTGEDGTILTRLDIDSFGRVVESAGNVDVPFLFTGRAYDHDLGIYYYRARYYDPDTGRFLSEDPNWGELDDTVQHNRYLYAHNAPTRYRDPMGLGPDLFDDLNQSLSALINKVGGNAGKAPSAPLDLTPSGWQGLSTSQYNHLRNLELQNWKLQHQLLFKRPLPQSSISNVDQQLRYFITSKGGKYGVKGAQLADKVEQLLVQHRQQLNQMIAKEAQRNLPVPAGQNQPVPVQPQASVRPSGPASSGLTGATPKPLALPGNGPNTPLLPPGRGTGYKVLTRGRANIGTIPTRAGEVTSGLLREGARIGVASGLTVLVGVGNYMMGNNVGERYRDWGRSRGRDPKLWSPEHGAASAEAGLRAYLGIKTLGFSEIAYWLGRTAIEQQRYHAALVDEQHAKDRLREHQKQEGYLPKMGERSRDLAEQAQQLRVSQLVFINGAKVNGESAKSALPELTDITPSATAQDCFDCQEASRRLRVTLSTLGEGLDSVVENARFATSAAQAACTRKNPDAADFEAARSGAAVQEAQAAAARLGDQIDLAKQQQAKLDACMPKVENLRPFLARIPETEGRLVEARTFAAASRGHATSAKRVNLQCVQLVGSCKNLGYATDGMTGQGEKQVLAQHCATVDRICAEVAADATLGETYAGTAETDIAAVDGALANLKAISTQVGACSIDPLPAGELQALQTAQTRVAGQLASAGRAAARAAECGRLIKAGQPPPGPGGIGGDSGGTGDGSGESGTPTVIGASGGGGGSTGQGDAPPVVEASGGGRTGEATTGDRPPVVEASTGGSGRQPAGGKEEVTGILAPIGSEDGKITKDEYGETQVTIRGADGKERLYSGQDAADRLVDAGYLTKRGDEYFPTDKFRSFGGPGTVSSGEEETGSGTTDLPVKKTRTADAAGGASTEATAPRGGETTSAGAGGASPPSAGGSGGTGTGAKQPEGEKTTSSGGLFGQGVKGTGLDCSLDVTAKMSECNKSRTGYATSSEIPADVSDERRKQIQAAFEQCRKQYQAEMDACYK